MTPSSQQWLLRAPPVGHGNETQAEPECEGEPGEPRSFNFGADEDAQAPQGKPDEVGGSVGGVVGLRWVSGPTDSWAPDLADADTVPTTPSTIQSAIASNDAYIQVVDDSQGLAGDALTDAVQVDDTDADAMDSDTDRVSGDEADKELPDDLQLPLVCQVSASTQTCSAVSLQRRFEQGGMQQLV